jgi:ABC-type transport system involved in multi-copper enzyme maturation permease subunit
MSYLGITFQNELIRLMRRKKTLTGILIAALLPLVVVAASLLALGRDATVLYREDLFRTALSLFAPAILPLFAVVLVADAFLEEQSKGSLRTSLLLPDSRSGHFFAKLGSAFTGAASMILSLWLFSLAAGLALPSRGEWLATLGTGFLQGLASLLPVLMVLGFSVLASQLMKSTGGMILSLLGLALVLRLLPFWLGDPVGILPTSWLGFGANIGYLPPAGILRALAVTLLWAVFTGGLALFRFERRVI